MQSELEKYQDHFYTQVYNTITHQEGPHYPCSRASTEEYICIDVLATDIFLFLREEMRDLQLNLMRDRLITIQNSTPFKIRMGSPDGKCEIIYHHEIELELNKWIRQAEGQTEEAAARIRKAYYSDKIELKLNNLGLDSIPSIITKLNHLRMLHLSTNRLTSFPSDPQFGQFLALRGIYLDNNRLKNFSTKILGNQLRQLTLDSNQLEEISLENVPKLNSLYLSDNHLKDLPWTQLSSLTDLVELDLDANSLENISSELWTLKNLKHLSLKYNNLSSIPPGIKALENLSYLDVSHSEMNEDEILRIESELSEREREDECNPMIFKY